MNERLAVLVTGGASGIGRATVEGFLGIKHAARVMQTMDTPGSIVNTASIAGLGGGAGPQAYSAAKAAVLNLTRLAAVELAPFRIRVNAVNPGAIATPIHGSGVKRLEGLVGDVQPWPEVVQAEQVASVICFLAGDAAGFITGEATRHIEGGVNIACRYKDTNALVLPMVMEIASEIEQSLYLHASERERSLFESFLRETRNSNLPVVSTGPLTA